MNISTADIIILFIGALLGIGQAITVKYLAFLGTTSVETQKDIASMKSTLNALPLASMQSEIKSNSDNIRVLDKELVKVGERVSSIEKSCFLHKEIRRNEKTT